MSRHSRTISYIIFGLLAIGILSNFRSLWLPLLIFGIIFYLYKFPPKQFQRGGQRNRSYRASGTVKPMKKKSLFRVIQGNKKDEDDHTPKYH